MHFWYKVIMSFWHMNIFSYKYANYIIYRYTDMNSKLIVITLLIIYYTIPYTYIICHYIIIA